MLKVGLRCDVSFQQRTTQRSAVTTMWVIEALSAPVKENPVDPVAMFIDLADDTAVHDSDDEFIGMRSGDPFDATLHPVAELMGGLAAGNHVPALLDVHELSDRVAVGDPLAELAALPVAEEHLAEVGLDDRGQPELLDERGSRLNGSLERGDVHRGDPFTGVDETLRSELRLLDALGGERWVAMAADEVERLTVDMRRRLAVTHQQDLRCARRWRES